MPVGGVGGQELRRFLSRSACWGWRDGSGRAARLGLMIRIRLGHDAARQPDLKAFIAKALRKARYYGNVKAWNCNCSQILAALCPRKQLVQLTVENHTRRFIQWR